MKEHLTSDCQRCEQCGSYFIEAIGETCRCPVPDDEPNFEQAMANRWLEGELAL
jgi:hypothetical protein